MAQISKYEIRILPDKEFFKVAKSDPRYGEVDETNLGFADPEKGKAYVRQTYWPDLNKGLLLHEFEHLVENDCPKGRAHQDQYGIKHKKFFKEGIAQPLAKLGEKLTPEWARKIPVIGPMLEAQRSVAQGDLSNRNIFGAFGAPLLTGATLGIGAGSGALGGIGRGMTNLLTQPAKAFQGGFQTLGRGLTSVEGKIGDVLQAFRPGAGTMGATGAGETGTGALSRFSSFGSSLLNKPMGNLAVAGGLLGASGLMGRTKVPQLSDFGSATDLQNEIMAMRRGQPTSPLTQQAFGRLGQRLQGEFPGVDPKILQQTNDTYDRLKANYTSQFKMFRPNADITSDSDYARGIMEIERRRGQDLSGIQQEEFNRYQERQTQAIGEALGIDRDTLQSLGNLTDEEIELALAQTTLDEGRKSQIRQFLGQLAGQFAAKGLGLNQYSINPTLLGFNVGGGK